MGVCDALIEGVNPLEHLGQFVDLEQRRGRIIDSPVERSCNHPMIGSYNNYHLSPNGIPSSNQRWYGLVYKEGVNLGQSLENG